MLLKSVKILSILYIGIIFPNIYTIQIIISLLCTQLLLFKYSNVILTETENCSISIL